MFTPGYGEKMGGVELSFNIWFNDRGNFNTSKNEIKKQFLTFQKPQTHKEYIQVFLFSHKLLSLTYLTTTDSNNWALLPRPKARSINLRGCVSQQALDYIALCGSCQCYQGLD